MKIEIFPGLVRAAKQSFPKKVWFVRFEAANGHNTFTAKEGYAKLASAVNAVESHMAELEARFGTNVLVLDSKNVVKKVFVFIHVHETETPNKKPFAYHYRRYGKLKPI